MAVLLGSVGRVRTKKFKGVTYKLVPHPKNIYYTKNEKEKKVVELKKKGFLVRTIDVSGYDSTGEKYIIWSK